jgi:hypothetical protein
MSDGDGNKSPPSFVRAGGAAGLTLKDFKLASTEQLKATRDYARSCTRHSLQECVAGCVEALDAYGFCVLDDVIPPGVVADVCEEVRMAPQKAEANRQAWSRGEEHGIRREGRLPYPSAPVCDLLWMPLLSQHLAHPVVTAVARSALDDHLRIAQFNYRAIPRSSEEQIREPGREMLREWHTDWPVSETPADPGQPLPLSLLMATSAACVCARGVACGGVACDAARPLGVRSRRDQLHGTEGWVGPTKRRLHPAAVPRCSDVPHHDLVLQHCPPSLDSDRLGWGS